MTVQSPRRGYLEEDLPPVIAPELTGVSVTDTVNDVTDTVDDATGGATGALPQIP